MSYFTQIIFVPKLNATSDELVKIHNLIAQLSVIANEYNITNCNTYPAKSDKKSLYVSIGGDGTALFSMKEAALHGGNVIAVNLGRLGYLADYSIASEESIKMLMDDFRYLCSGKVYELKTESRSLLFADYGNTDNDVLAANEFGITHETVGTMVDYKLYVDGIFVGHQRGDGILISTPTGSTAYSLSVGGSIMHPELDGIQIVMVAPHRISSRPLIVPHDSTITVEASSTNTNLVVLADGQTLPKNNSKNLTINIEQYRNNVILWHNKQWNYYSNLGMKMGWWND